MRGSVDKKGLAELKRYLDDLRLHHPMVHERSFEVLSKAGFDDSILDYLSGGLWTEKKKLIGTRARYPVSPPPKPSLRPITRAVFEKESAPYKKESAPYKLKEQLQALERELDYWYGKKRLETFTIGVRDMGGMGWVATHCIPNSPDFRQVGKYYVSFELPSILRVKREVSYQPETTKDPYR